MRNVLALSNSSHTYLMKFVIKLQKIGNKTISVNKKQSPKPS